MDQGRCPPASPDPNPDPQWRFAALLPALVSRYEICRIAPVLPWSLFGAIAAVQLPDILIEIDALTHFSWILLGRQPASTTELMLVYCALLGLGTMQSAASVSRMVAGVSDDQIEHVMRQIIASGQLRAASDAVVNYMLSLPVARRWGTGKQASVQFRPERGGHLELGAHAAPDLDARNLRHPHPVRHEAGGGGLLSAGLGKLGLGSTDPRRRRNDPCSQPGRAESG
ncbi:hypothetical protein TQ38_026445 (plasmid) [Novosphingobium sp. P6W]|nr:hypothetical protein TQ38_026445 [Novosphingobium sp. P6W]